LASAGLVVVLAVWSRNPSLAAALLATVLAVLVAATTARERRFGVLACGALAVGASVAALATSVRSRNVEQRWPDIREALIRGASERLDRTLGNAVDLARSVTARAAALADEERLVAMERLQDALADGQPEHGVAILDGVGQPWAWAGRHRVPARPLSRELSARITPFYVLLEAGRQVGAKAVVGHVVLAADSAVPDPEVSLAWRFTRETGAGLEFFPPGSGASGPDVFDYCLPSCQASALSPAPDTLFSVRPVPPSQGSYKLALLASGTRWTGLVTIGLLVLLSVFGSRVGRWGGVVGLLALLTLTPTGERVGLGPLFNSAIYFADALGPLSASAGALLLTAAVVAAAFLQLGRRAARPRRLASVLGILPAVAWPSVLWSFSRGVSVPTTFVGPATWLSWQVTLTMVGAAAALALAALLSRPERPSPRWVAGLAVAWAAGLAIVNLVLWQPFWDWPWWYAALWIPAVYLAAQPAPRPRLLLTVGVVAGTAAALLSWGAVLHGRLVLADLDARRLRGGDPVAIGFLERFQAALGEDPAPRSAADLYAKWRRAPLSQWDYPGALATWGPDGRQIATLELAQLGIDSSVIASVGQAARESGVPLLRDVEVAYGVRYVGAVPFGDGTVVTILVAPRSQLIRPVLVGRFLRGERRLLAPYEMFLGEPMPPAENRSAGLTWRRDGWTLRGTLPLPAPTGARQVHATVRMLNPWQLLVRGMLSLLVDVVLLGLVGIAATGLSRRLRLPPEVSEALRFRSYRVRLTVALAVFFVVPALGFAAWSVGRLRSGAVRQGDLLIQQTLGAATSAVGSLAGTGPGGVESGFGDMFARMDADLMWYERGLLVGSSTRVLAELGLTGAYLDPQVFLALAREEAAEVTADASIGGQETRVGYRSVEGSGAGLVLAVPRLVDVTGLHRDQEDLALGLLLGTLLGLAGAVGLAGAAGRSLARPVQSLRAAAAAVGRGDDLPPFDPGIPTEFASVVEAFERMASDVEASQNALEQARRRTAAVLQNVATGVIALDHHMQMTIANPRAGDVLGASLEPGVDVRDQTDSRWAPVWDWATGFLRGSEMYAEREFTIEAMRVRARIAALHADPSGCVLALDDTTELARAVRVLAWGEIARQVAHEIKNPLTPIRLGIQHLQRARRHGTADFDATLEQTARQILAEIERLDAIARAFSRFGAPPAEAVPLSQVDVAAVARDTAGLYALGSETIVGVEADHAVTVRARKDEVREVLINLIENARNAGATHVDLVVRQDSPGRAVLEIRDDGRGIPEDDLPHIFEPHFSTTTSGTGLGLAICKRLVESWGGMIKVESDGIAGTRVTIVLEG